MVVGRRRLLSMMILSIEVRTEGRGALQVVLDRVSETIRGKFDDGSSFHQYEKAGRCPDHTTSRQKVHPPPLKTNKKARPAPRLLHPVGPDSSHISAGLQPRQHCSCVSTDEILRLTRIPTASTTRLQ